MNGGRVWVAAVVVAALAGARSARADDTATARVRFQEGVELFDKGQYDRARAAFLQAWALKKHPAVLLNLAESCLKSNHPGEAARWFSKYAREATDITPAQKAQAERGLAEARKRDGRLDVLATAGTEITVDDERAGSAPLAEPYDVDPGAHVVRVKGEADQNVTVAAGQTLTLRFGAAAGTGAGTSAGTSTSASAAVGTTDAQPGGTPDAQLGAPGESCRARSDCKPGLKCVARKCAPDDAPSSSEGRAGRSEDEDAAVQEWLAMPLEGVHPFAGLSWVGGPAWMVATTGNASVNDRNLQGSFLFSLRGGVYLDRHELALELSPFTYVPYNTASLFFRGATFRVAGTYGYLIPIHEAEAFAVYWPLRVGVGFVAGANNTQGLAYFEGRFDGVGVAFRVGHLMIDVMAPSFRYTFTHRLGTAIHVMSWHAGGAVSYAF